MKTEYLIGLGALALLLLTRTVRGGTVAPVPLQTPAPANNTVAITNLALGSAVQTALASPTVQQALNIPANIPGVAGYSFDLTSLQGTPLASTSIWQLRELGFPV